MYYTIYQTINNINKKIYIGKHETDNLNDSYMGSGKYLKSAINKYGIKNFTKTILFIFDNEQQMNQKEVELVTEDFCKSKNTYNICIGGKGGFSFINKTIDFTNRNRKISKKRTYKEPNFVEKISKNKMSLEMRRQNYKNNIAFQQSRGMLGKYHTKKTKQQQSITHLGERNPQFGTMWITDGVKNKKINNLDMIPKGWYKGRKLG